MSPRKELKGGAWQGRGQKRVREWGERERGREREYERINIWLREVTFEKDLKRGVDSHSMECPGFMGSLFIFLRVEPTQANARRL